MADLIIRTDANVAIGTGHVMRCIALAQAWCDGGGRAVFAMAESTPAVEERLRSEGFALARVTVRAGSEADAEETARLAQVHGASWVVVDGYGFGADYQAGLKSRGLKVLFIDDNGHADHYSADIVLNQNVHASKEMYRSRDGATRLLLGSRFAMLRREFKSRRGWKRSIPEVARRVLVTMGGSDPDDVTTKVIKSIAELSNPDLETVVLVGGSNARLRSVESLLQKSSMRLMTDVSDMPEIMAWADVAVAGAGTTFWEMCFLGLPGILLVLAKNQERIAAAAEQMGVAWNLGEGTTGAHAVAEKLSELVNSANTRASQSEQGRRIVDGRGAERVAAFLSGLELEKTTEADCEIFWEWANEPGARAASFRNKAISWEHHAEWFRAKLADPNAILYTARNGEGVRIGQVRYQISGERALLSIGLGARFRGLGWGRKMLTVGVEKLFGERQVGFIDAYVKATNAASLRLFAGAGFERGSPEVIEGQEAVHFVLGRDAAG